MKFIVGIGMLSIGYVLAYYGLDVLIWAHSGGAGSNTPPPMAPMFGIKTLTSSKPFSPLINLEDSTDPRVPLGGAPGALPTATPGSPNPFLPGTTVPSPNAANPPSNSLNPPPPITRVPGVQGGFSTAF